ncbi:MAG TPA: protein kinase [Bryobacteraceae bacterium]|nr:protein kinase [Bryobacteraceae bacterium]
MTPERWGQLEELYEAVRALPPSERTALLERADPELRATVASILSHEASRQEDGAFLDRPAWEGRQSLLKHDGPLQAETPVSVGEQLGPYRIEKKIGQGGMGTVYRATDTRLDRPVAIKISSGLFDKRFEREARAISSLNHPHICTLHDIGPDYMVMEMVEGETMAARIRKGALPVSDVLRYGAQIAGALAAAHDKNITHRDLKPANVMITKNGVKVLDFGLAKCSTHDGTLTGTGAVMGTPAYMAPEQLEGKEADTRTDIFALGHTLYEMATAKRIVPGQPPAMEGLPERFVHVLERCLEPEPENRWQSARDVKAELEWAADRGTRSSAGASALRPKRTWLWMAVVALSVAVAGGIAWTLLQDRPAAPVAALNVSLLPPPETSFRFARNGEGGFALSPDGTRLAFVGRTEGKAQLWVRSLGESEARLLPGTEAAYEPFWSPDSHWIAFFTPQKLKKIEVATGAVIDLCDVPSIPNLGTWSPRGVIVWGNSVGMVPIQRISDAGGSLMPVPGTAGGYSPHFLPDGRRFVYMPGGPGLSTRHDLWLASLDPGEKPRRIGEAGTQPTYSAGHILSVVNGVLTARPFDAARGEFTGESFSLKAPLAHRVSLGHLLTDYSANVQGMLVYPPQAGSLMELRWRDRTGKQVGSLGAPGEYYTPRISPDGRRVAFTRRDGTNSDIWVSNPPGNSFMRLTFDPGIDENPVWSPDGAAVTFGNDAEGRANLYRKAASGAGAIERLTTKNTTEQQPLDWSRDGRFLLYTQISLSAEIMVLASSGGQSLSFLGQNLGAGRGQFNPGVPRWVAYDFDDSGRREIYVQAFEPGQRASSARWQISDSGGTMPRWRGDGKEIFYLSLDGKMMAVRVSSDGDAFHSSTPQFLFKATPPEMRTPNFEYDVSPDGERFLMIEPREKPEYQPLTLVSDWRSR